MRKLFTFLVAVLLTASVFAQSPEKMSYQAVIRDASDNLITDTQIGMQISILQGSASGTAVYVETQEPTTNANGLVSLEIGAGTVESGDFTTIDWANGPYFIKTETAVEAPLTTYTITGTSQLLSVPYALHAKTAETVTGAITETDPTFTSSQAANIDATDITNLGNLSGVNTGDQDLSTLALKTNVLELDNTTAFTPDADYEPATKKYVDDNAGSGSTVYSVGDFAQGGIVFWVDETGQHGLVAAKVDQDGGSGIQWYDGSYTDTEAHGDGVYAGEMNTMLIIANQGSNSNDYAAGVCANYTVTESGVTYGDWYLPSKEELNLMYQNKATIDATAGANEGSGFASFYYWSSTEIDNVNAWTQTFDDGNQGDASKVSTARVRAVRAF